MIIEMTFGQRLKRRLSELNMNQNQLASELNISPSTLSDYSRDRTQPDFETIIKISNVLDTSVEYLITGRRISPSALLTELAATLDDPKLQDTYKKLVELEPGYLELAADQLDAIFKKQKKDKK